MNRLTVLQLEEGGVDFLVESDVQFALDEDHVDVLGNEFGETDLLLGTDVEGEVVGLAERVHFQQQETADQVEQHD